MRQSQFWILCAVTMLAPHTPPRWSLAIAVTYLVVAFLTFRQEGKK